MVEKRVSTGTAKRHNLLDPHFIANTCDGFSGFTVFESDDQKEIASLVMQYTLAGMRVKIYPMFTGSDAQLISPGRTEFTT